MTEKNQIIDILGEKVKKYESAEVKQKLNPNQPICLRLDGKAFHTFTKGLERPFDSRLSNIMVDTMNFLIKTTGAHIGYTQSDEITLVYFKTAPHQEYYFDGRIQKLTSIISSMTTAKFNSEISKHIPEKSNTFAYFDCRVWNVPSLDDLSDLMIWRQEDAIKNAISMAAHAKFGHKKILNKSGKEKVNMLLEEGIDFNSYPDFFKSGTYARKAIKELPLSEEMKGKKGNENKTTILRGEIVNFHLPRLKHQENVYDLLWTPIFDFHKTTIEEKIKHKNILKIKP